MGNKVTIKDIARLAGVSVATVSYVLNDRKDQKISEATRKKVLQMVNLVGYTSNQSARSLATGRKNCIAVCEPSPPLTLRSAERRPLLDAMVRCFAGKGYSTALLAPDVAAPVGYADAIVCLGMEAPAFCALGDANMAPMIAFDMLVKDTLFYCVNLDYRAVYTRAAEYFGGADFTLLTCPTGNAELTVRIEEIFGGRVAFCDTPAEAMAYANGHSGDNTLVVGSFIWQLVSGTLISGLEYRRDYEQPAREVYECIINNLERTGKAEHDILTP